MFEYDWNKSHICFPYKNYLSYNLNLRIFKSKHRILSSNQKIFQECNKSFLIGWKGDYRNIYRIIRNRDSFYTIFFGNLLGWPVWPDKRMSKCIQINFLKNWILIVKMQIYVKWAVKHQFLVWFPSEKN